MAGFWNLSLNQIQDLNGKPIVGARAYFYKAGTTTPMRVFKNNDLSTELTNPLPTDGYGRFPPVYMDEADGFYRVRMTTPTGVILFDVDQLPIFGQSSGGGGGGASAPVDLDATFKTGDIFGRYGMEVRPGAVRLNGRSIGSAVSGASERANADTRPLYEYLWFLNPALPVIGGRSGSAAADWAANKQLVLPDFRGRALVGFDNMGNGNAGVVAAATNVGWFDGTASHTLTQNEMPYHAHGAYSDAQGQHAHGIATNVNTLAGRSGVRGGNTPGDAVTQQTEAAGSHSHNITVSPAGGGAAHNNMQPSMGISIYMRL